MYRSQIFRDLPRLKTMQHENLEEKCMNLGPLTHYPEEVTAGS